MPTLPPLPSTLSFLSKSGFSFSVVILMLPRFSLFRYSNVLVTVFLIICFTTFTAGKESPTATVLFLSLPYPVG